MYTRHKSPALNDLFIAKPFQGAEPETARFLFIGLDANYDSHIEQSPVFPRLLEYLNDGPAFWRKYLVHHPFLLPEYRGAGRKYHRTFAEIGFNPNDAEHVSFIELLHVPTEGTKNPLTKADLDLSHMQRINSAILRGKAQLMFIPTGVGRLMKTSDLFPWLPAKPTPTEGPLRIWYKTQTKTMYWHYHFSVYGKFEHEKKQQLAAIRSLARGENQEVRRQSFLF